MRSLRNQDWMRKGRDPHVLCQWYFDKFSISEPKAGNLAGLGAVELTIDGRVNIKASVKAHITAGFLGKALTIAGSARDGHMVALSSGHISRTSFGGFQTNALLKAIRCRIDKPGKPITAWTERHYWLKNIRCAGQGTFQLKGFQFTLEPLPGYDLNRSEPGQINAVLTVKSPVPSTDDISDFIDDVCALISVAQRSYIGWVRVEVSDAANNGYIELRELAHDHSVPCPLVDYFTQDICNFVAQVFPQFERQKQFYSLRVLIDHYWRAHTETYVDMKFIFGSVFMEALKFEWAKNVATHLHPRIGQNGLIKAFRRAGSKSDMSFEELLIELCTHLNYPAQPTIVAQGSVAGQVGTFTFLDNRNALFHSGQSAAPQLGHANVWQYLKPELHKLFDQMDDLFLRILGFSGKIYRISKPNAPVPFP